MRRKLIIILYSIAFLFIPLSLVEIRAEENYESYVDLIMSSGKLIRDFTEEEYYEAVRGSETNVLFGFEVNPINSGVKASYISNTIVSFNNSGETEIKISRDIDIETNNVVTFSSTISGEASVSGGNKLLKEQIAIKASVSYSEKSEESVKMRTKMDVVVEPNSSMIIYLTGSLTVFNGGYSYYFSGRLLEQGLYEYVILNSQYSKLEKVSNDYWRKK